uniref:Cytochrome n=1 Tax=Macrostomum lignano TaxID=282301 RepID=A0A1I8FRJ6_9PLAT
MKDFRDMMMTGTAPLRQVYGTYFMRQPVLVVADPEMVKQICVKRAENFIDRSTFGMDFSPLNKGVLMLKGQEWKRVRSLLSPTFSSGKIKAMYPLIEQCSNQLCASLLKAPEETVDIKKYLMNFTMDAVACTMFGLQVNAQEDENSEFKKHTNEVFNMSMRSWKFWALILFPRITKPLFLSIPDLPVQDGDAGLLPDGHQPGVARARSLENADKYSDFLASMVEARREAESQTTATALQYLAYFLAFNKQCQERAYLEVIEARDKHGGTLSYECVQGLKYLGHCIDESMRMCPHQ